MYGNHFYGQPQRFQPMDQLGQQFNNQYMSTIQQVNTQMNLLGKSVDSIEVVKAMDIPLDGSISYFPLTDGSAIVTKKLQADGTSKTVIYKPVEESKGDTKFLVMEDLENIINDINDMKDLKEQFSSVKKDIKELKDKIGVA